jgi:hypothetical protein
VSTIGEGINHVTRVVFVGDEECGPVIVAPPFGPRMVSGTHVCRRAAVELSTGTVSADLIRDLEVSE